MKTKLFSKLFPFVKRSEEKKLKEKAYKIQLSYKNILKSLSFKIKNDKIKVVFLVRENSKWAYQSLYDLFAKDDRFEPVILVSILILCHKGKDKTRNNLEENYNFFKSRGMNVDYAYRNGRYIDLKEFNPDIVFYDQQYDLPNCQTPEYVSDFSLTCYSSYSYELLECEDDYTQNFHSFLFRLFVEHDLNLERFKSYKKYDLSNCYVSGYPKIDVYLEDKQTTNIWKDKNKIKIIYAPHHSVDKKGLHFSMFVQSAKYILEFAKKHPETTWIFKPHPRLKYALIRSKTLDAEKIEAYYNEWAKIGIVYEQGDYFDIFKTSDLMITDSCSFLAEYLPSKKPLIRLLNSSAVKLNSLGQKITSEYYIAKNNKELENLFNEVITNKNDYKKQARQKLINEIIDFKESAAHKIYKNLLDSITDNY